MHKEWVEVINKEVPEAQATLVERTVGDSPIFVSPGAVLKACETLKSHPKCGFNVLQVITGTDYPEASTIEVSYVLANFIDNTELILKTKLPRDNPRVESVTGVWKAANFQERECYDMLGVVFVGHPDPRRILCPDDWEGFPLRKDYKPAEKYKHMTINPEHKMNIADREFAAKQKEAEDKAKAAAKAAGNPDSDSSES